MRVGNKIAGKPSRTRRGSRRRRSLVRRAPRAMVEQPHTARWVTLAHALAARCRKTSRSESLTSSPEAECAVVEAGECAAREYSIAMSPRWGFWTECARGSRYSRAGLHDPRRYATSENSMNGRLKPMHCGVGLALRYRISQCSVSRSETATLPREPRGLGPPRASRRDATT